MRKNETVTLDTATTIRPVSESCTRSSHRSHSYLTVRERKKAWEWVVCIIFFLLYRLYPVTPVHMFWIRVSDTKYLEKRIVHDWQSKSDSDILQVFADRCWRTVAGNWIAQKQGQQRHMVLMRFGSLGFQTDQIEKYIQLSSKFGIWIRYLCLSQTQIVTIDISKECTKANLNGSRLPGHPWQPNLGPKHKHIQVTTGGATLSKPLSSPQKESHDTTEFPERDMSATIVLWLIPAKTSDTHCRESPSAWRTEHKKHVHLSFILNNGKLSLRRATALVSLEMIDPKKNPFNCTSKKDVW